MESIVCIKQVPDTSEVKIDPVTNTLIRHGVPSIINPFDKNALEAAVQLKEIHGGTVTVLTMGPPQAVEALRECLSLGADKAYLVSDRAFSGADTLATSYTLAAAIRRIGKFDLIFCGKQAIDGDTAQVGPEIAEFLDVPQVTFVSKILVKQDNIQVEKEQDDGYEVIEVELPALLAVVKSINIPRYPSIKSKMAARKVEIETITAEDLDIDNGRLGLGGSATQVKKIFSPKKRSSGTMIQLDNDKEAALELFERILENSVFSM
ncbi:electron transfer flavoprotein subunit beta/FixA family protein [Acetobacterium malicum]|uniref:electron transfer flavoprotein subunit beta/FixA family protein n=1 Tax=Acetobacterium malicum TaxID=52692 RepID=UPI0004222550|nr:electron transfer flavoprotein subunit beta/FixA family protein [Acetobacterium dehalogenans]